MRKRKFFASLLVLTLSGCSMPNENRIEPDRYLLAQHDWCILNEEVELPQRPVTLDELIEMGLERSLDLQVHRQEAEVQHEIATGEKFNMLPNLKYHIADSGRNRNTGASSQSLTNQPPAPPSISSEQNSQTWNLNLEWHLLDFGVSFYRARHDLDLAYAKRFQYERAKQKLILEIVQEYWRAVMARKAMKRAKKVIENIERASYMLTENASLRYISEMTVIEREDNLMTIHRGLMAFDKIYHESMCELKRLISVSPQLELELPDEEPDHLKDPGYDVVALEKLALLNRPELYTNDFHQRASIEQVHEAFIKIFPGATVFWNADHDSNKFLIFNYWMQIGVRAAWDLLRTPYKYNDYRVAKSKKVLTEMNRMAASMGVITQVNLAHIVYLDNLHEYKVIKEQHQIKQRRLEIAEKRYEAGLIGEEELTRFEGESLEVEADLFGKYANLQISLERLNNAIGLPRYLDGETLP